MISNFINLSSYCVLEFRATPIGDANPPLLTSQFYLVDNKHLGIKQIYNTDDYSTTTRNTRSFSLIGLGGSKLIYNDITLTPLYSDFDPLITETTVSSELSINMVMDTMRFHFASGFNFTDVEHIIVGARHKLNNITQIQLANIILNAVTTASLFSYNTRPLFLANTIYDKYIDIKIPSIPWLDADFTQFGASSFEHAITGGIGFIKNAPITVFLAEATKSNYYASNNIAYEQYQITQYYEGSVSQINKFDTLGCYIAEAEDGDYIEFFATWNGAFPDSLIATLNESGADQEWIISHQLTIYEHIGSDIVLSGNSLIYQETNFDTPLTYRPILKQAGFAVAMSIDYIMRLINKKNGDQIIKSASMSIINPNRYGKKLQKIELLNGPQSMRIYNKIEQKNFESNAIFSGSVPSISTSAPNTEELTATITTLTATLALRTTERNNALITTTPVIKQLNIQLSSGNALSPVGEELIYGQGRAILVIDPVDNLIKLTLWRKGTIGTAILTLGSINLVTGFTGVTFKLTFGTTNDFIFSNTSIGTISNLASGELLFRIPKIQAKLILENSENTFMVTKVDPTGTETLMYSGTWLSSSDYQAANAATDIARENAITAAALATALATIDTLRDQRDNEFNLKTAAITAKNDAINQLNQHMLLPHPLSFVIASGEGGAGATSGSSGSSGSSGGPIVVPNPTTPIITGIVGPSSGPPGTIFGLSGDFNGTITNIKFGTPFSLFQQAWTKTNTSMSGLSVPPGAPSGVTNITVQNTAGTSGAIQFTVVYPPTISVSWTLYIGPLVAGGNPTNANSTPFAAWHASTNLYTFDLFEIKTLVGNVETPQVTIGTFQQVADYSHTMINNDGYISGSFSYALVNDQIKFKVTRTLSTYLHLSSPNRNQVKLGADTIHYQNRSTSTSGTSGYQPSFDTWTYNPTYVNGEWMIFNKTQLFSSPGVPVTLSIEAVLI